MSAKQVRPSDLVLPHQHEAIKAHFIYDDSQRLVESYTARSDTEPFLRVRDNLVTVGTLALAFGPKIFTINEIQFGSCFLTTTNAKFAGSLEVSAHVQAGGLTLSSASIQDGSGGISFGANLLSTMSAFVADTISTSDAAIITSSPLSSGSYRLFGIG